MANWLVKTEPELYSIQRLQRERCTLWTGVRNYQARNYLRSMNVGDVVLVYHSQSEPSAVMGTATVTKPAVPDPTQFVKADPAFDPKASKEEPRWFSPELTFVEQFREPLPLPMLRSKKGLQGMVLLQRGSRLSVQPVTDGEMKIILELGKRGVKDSA